MKMQLIDTHSHLYLDDFQPDRRAVIERAVNEGVERIFLPAIDSSEHGHMFQLEAEWPSLCAPMMGLHPCSVKANVEEELKMVEDWLGKRKFAAVGEIGLDYYWDRSFDMEQVMAFRRQIEWALAYDLPIVIHSRESLGDCIDLVRQYQKGKLTGIFHCFTGDLESAKAILDLGFYLGIGGVVTYKKTTLPEVLAHIPVDSVVLETDAPYLAPVPFRGKRNESGYLKYVAAKLAEIKQLSMEEIAAITSANAQKVFRT
jgi:TatD DNase family protein